VSHRYSEAFKSRMVQRLTMPGGPSAAEMAEEVNVPQPTLSRWVRQAASLGGVSKKKKTRSVVEREPRSLRQWTPAEKLRVISEMSQLADEELGAFLRREGLHQAQLEAWRADILAALGQPPTRRRTAETKATRALEKELARKEKALAEVTALLVLKKKVDALFEQEDEDDSTDENNEKN